MYWNECVYCDDNYTLTKKQTKLKRKEISRICAGVSCRAGCQSCLDPVHVWPRYGSSNRCYLVSSITQWALISTVGNKRGKRASHISNSAGRIGGDTNICGFKMGWAISRLVGKVIIHYYSYYSLCIIHYSKSLLSANNHSDTTIPYYHSHRPQ